MKKQQANMKHRLSHKCYSSEEPQSQQQHCKMAVTIPVAVTRVKCWQWQRSRLGTKVRETESMVHLVFRWMKEKNWIWSYVDANLKMTLAVYCLLVLSSVSIGCSFMVQIIVHKQGCIVLYWTYCKGFWIYWTRTTHIVKV